MAISSQTKNLIRPEIERLESIKSGLQAEKQKFKDKIDLLNAQISDVQNQIDNLKLDLNAV